MVTVVVSGGGHHGCASPGRVSAAASAHVSEPLRLSPLGHHGSHELYNQHTMDLVASLQSKVLLSGP